MARAGIEQRRRTRDIVQLREQLVELQCVRHVGAQRDGNAHPEVLRSLDDVASCGMFEQIPVIQRAQAKVIDLMRSLGHNCVVELAGMGFDEAQHPLIDPSGHNHRHHGGGHHRGGRPYGDQHHHRGRVLRHR